MLIGRDRELAVLRDFAVGHPRRDPPVLLLTGETGIGKTALLDAVVAAVRDDGPRIVRATGLQFDVDFVFEGLNQLLLPLAGFTPSVPDPLRGPAEIICGARTGPPPDQLTADAAALALIRAAAVTQAVLFVVDDAPLLDRASAMALAYVARRVPDVDVRFLLAERIGLENPFVRSGFDVYPVAPLPDSSADALLGARFPALPAEIRARVRVAARGNPLALLDLPVAADPDLGSPTGVAAHVERVRAGYEGQLHDLPTDVRRRLLFLVLGAVEDGAPLRSLLERAGDDVDLAPAVTAGLLSTTTAGYVFRHPLVRAAVVEVSPIAERRRVHALLADAFLDDPRRRAWHLGESAAGRDSHVADELEWVAADLLSLGDARQAISAMLRSAELTPDRTVRARRVARGAYLTSLLLGDLAIDGSAAGAVTPDARAASLTAVVAGAYRLLNLDGDAVSVHRLVGAALDETTDPLDAAQNDAMEALHVLAAASLAAGRSEIWDETRRQLHRVVPRPPATLALYRDLFTDSPAPDAAALAELDRELVQLRLSTDPLRITRVAIAGAHLDRIGRVRDALLRVTDDRAGGGAVAKQIESLLLLATDDLLAGDWAAMDKRVDEAATLCDDRSFALLHANARYLRGLGAALRGGESADRDVEELLLFAAPRGLVAIAGWASHIRCLHALAQEDFAAAFRHAASVAPPATIRAYRTTSLWMVLDVVESAVRSGHADVARDHVAALKDAGVDALSPRLALTMGGAAALVARDDWYDRFAAALAVPGGEAFPFDRARVELLFGERLRRDRRLTEARAHLGAARQAFTQLGATPWQTRSDRELRAAGGPSDGGAAGLTPQELAVARLAASGLTNKQIAARMFLSPRTVSTHLSRVFAKLGVTSRAGLGHALDYVG